MAEVLRLREAARLIGVSPGKLYRAIADGRLTAAPGGGPGKPTLVTLEAVQTFCQREGLRVPDGGEPIERSERSMPAISLPKAAVLKRLRAMQAEGLSLQAMANRFNKEGVPTLSGKGTWQKGTIGNLLAQAEE